MGKVILGTTMSLDGYIADRNGDVSRLYPDLEEMRNIEFLQESMQRTGAVVMGRRASDMANGDFTAYEYQVPIFVLTHKVPERTAKGENGRSSFTFVTQGIESAVEQAKAAAGDKDVTIIGGASTAQQCIRAGVIDELVIGIMPLILGEGLRFFGNSVTEQMELEKTRVIGSPTRTDIQFRVVKRET